VLAHALHPVTDHRPQEITIFGTSFSP
jgi:hypothetical protein